MRKLNIAVAANRSAKKWQSKPTTWTAFCAKLEEQAKEEKPIDAHTYHNILTPAQRGEMKDGLCYIPSELDGPRKKEFILTRDIVTLDVDHLGSEEQLEAMLKALEDLGVEFAAHTTLSHTDDTPRLRLLLPFAEPIAARDYQPVSRLVAAMIANAAQLSFDIFDDTTFEHSRLMYFPSSLTDAAPYLQYSTRRRWLDTEWANGLASVYGVAFDDWTTWPTSSRRAAPASRDTKLADPTTKDGWVGSFCRVYDVPSAIAEFIPDVYTQETDTRYTFNGSTSFGGLVLYDFGMFAYSNHESDPLYAQCVNAFDLVRIHKFGHRDKLSDKEGAQAPSYKAMVEFAQGLDDVVADAHAQSFSKVEALMAAADAMPAPVVVETNTEQVAPPTPSNSDEWRTEIDYRQDGTIASTINNFVLFMLHLPQLAGAAWLNEFDGGAYKRGAVEWDPSPEVREWSDADDAQLRMFFEKNFKLTGVAKLADATAIVAQRRAFHPIKEYLEGLPDWDGVERIADAPRAYFGAEGTTLERAYMVCFMVAAIKRIYEPGCKFDEMLTIVGPQGMLKSTFFSTLSGRAYFNDSLKELKGKDAFEILDGSWIVEMAELTALSKSEDAELKQFLSSSADRYRKAYARNVSLNKRQSVIVGTTNREEFLKDPTGARRFWAIKALVNKPTKSIATDLAAERDALWAEAYTLYQFGEPTYLSDELKALQVDSAESFMEVDARQGAVEAFVFADLPESWPSMNIQDRRAAFRYPATDGGKTFKRNRITAQEVWCELWGKELHEMLPRNKREINDILRRMKGLKSKTVRMLAPDTCYGTKPVTGFSVELVKEEERGL